MKSLKRALAKNKTLKVLKMNHVTNGDDVGEELFEQLGNALALSTSLEKFSFLVMPFDWQRVYTWRI